MNSLPVKPFSFPLQLEMRVPFGPTAVPHNNSNNLLYELYMTNFGGKPVTLRRIELVNETNKGSAPVAAFDSIQLKTMVKLLGANDPPERMILSPGQTAIVYVEVKLENKRAYPKKLIHRIITDADSLEGAVIPTQNTQLQILGPPVRGNAWLAADAPSNDVDNHHRRGNIILDGNIINSRRYAIDWKKVKDGVSFSGNSKDVHAYFCYGEDLFAVGNAVVVNATDGLPDNIPGHGKDFKPAIPLTFERLAGNKVVLDLGGGHYVYYMHLQPGSVRVKKGDRIRKGQLLGKIGASGDAREPHVHFEITTSPELLFGEGIPYVIDRYRLNLEPKGTSDHIHELPADGEVIDFGGNNGPAK